MPASLDTMNKKTRTLQTIAEFDRLIKTAEDLTQKQIELFSFIHDKLDFEEYGCNKKDFIRILKDMKHFYETMD